MQREALSEPAPPNLRWCIPQSTSPPPKAGFLSAHVAEREAGAEAAAPGDGRRRAAVAVPDPRERLRLFRAVDLHPTIDAADGEVPPALGLPCQGDGLGFQGLGVAGL